MAMTEKDKIAAIDAENKSLAEAIRKNNSARNALVPISSLPLELLCRTFFLLRESSLEDMSENKTASPSSWTVVSQICHTWRMASQRDSQLWSRVQLGPSFPYEQTEQVFKRSQGVPLSVEVTEKLDDRHVAIFSTIMSQAHRLLSLTVTGDPQVAVHMQKLRYSSAPLLHKLVLKNNRKQRAQAQRYTQSTHVVNPPVHMVDLLTGGTPQLRHLELQALTLPWSSSLLRGLTTLKVHVPAPGYFPGTPHEFFNAMRSMPGLEVLDMEVYFSDGMKDFRRDYLIALRSLTTLRLKMPIRHCVTVLAHLSIPLSSSLTVVVDQGPDSQTPSGGQDLMAVIHSAWLSDPLSQIQPSPYGCDNTPPNATPQILRSMVVSLSEDANAMGVQIQGLLREIEFGDHGFSIQAIPSPCEWDDEDLGENPSLVIQISQGLVDELLSSDQPPLHNLLWFMTAAKLQSTTWNRLANLPSLESVLLNDATAYGFVMALKDETSFPNLSNIAFDRVDFGHDNYGDEPAWDEDPIELEWLTEYLSLRLDSEHDGSKPIQHLDLSECINVFAKEFSELTKLVPKVSWDRSETRRGEDDIRPPSQCTCYGTRCNGDCYF